MLEPLGVNSQNITLQMAPPPLPAEATEATRGQYLALSKA